MQALRVRGSEHDQPACELAGRQIDEGLVRLGERVPPRDQLVELEATAQVEPGVPREVDRRVRGAVYGADQPPLTPEQPVRSDLDRPSVRRGVTDKHARTGRRQRGPGLL